VVYVSCFCRKAANTKNLDWGDVDFTLYNETFVSRAKILQCCNICLSELHITSECTLVTTPYPTKQDGSSQGWRIGGKKSVPICLLYNDRRVTSVHMHQTANMATLVQPAKEGTLSQNTQIGVFTHILLEICYTTRIQQGKEENSQQQDCIYS